jgi:hypothetical protein
LKTITGLTPGASYPVTVGKVPTTFGTTRSGAGLVIIEY